MFFINHFKNIFFNNLFLNNTLRVTGIHVFKRIWILAKRKEVGDIVVFDYLIKDLFPGVCKALEFIEDNFPYEAERMNFKPKKIGYAIASNSKS